MGEEVTITKHGTAAAVVVRPDTLRTRRAAAAFPAAALVSEGLAQGRARPLGASPTITEARAEELIADVLIYAAVDGHPLDRRVRALFPSGPVTSIDSPTGIGSVLLIPEVLTEPLRSNATDELADLNDLLGRLDLLPVDRATAELATAFAASYRLRAADAVHLATAVAGGADRFLTTTAPTFP